MGEKVSYADARARIATVLATVAITSPIEQTIKKVYADPPGTIGDVPCFILYGSSGSVGWMMGGTSGVESHTERVRLLIYDSDLDRAANIVRAYRMALLTAFASEGGLGNAAVIEGFSWDEPASFSYGGKDFTGQDFMITFNTD